MHKTINTTLLIILIVLGVETTMNIIGRKALLENRFHTAEFYLSLIRDKELLGLVYYKQDKFEKAYNYYKEIKDWRGMGWAYYGLGKYDDAQEYFRRVNDLAGLGQVELAKGNYVRARELFAQTHEKSGLGLTYLADADYKNALKSFTDAGDYLGLGLSYFAKGDFLSTREVFQHSENQTVKSILALIDQKVDRAKNIFSELNDTNLLAATLRYMGNHDQAASLYRDQNNREQLARTLLEMHHFFDAFNAYTKDTDLIGLGDLYFALGDYQRAFDFYQQAKADKKSFDAALAGQNPEKAVKVASKSLKANPNQTDLSFQFIDLLRLRDEQKEAAKLLQEYQERPSLKARELILSSRMDISREKADNLEQKLQEAIDVTGPGYLSRDILHAANMRGIQLNAPDREKTRVMITRDPLSLFKYIFYGLGLIPLFAVGFILVRRQMKKAPKLETVALKVGRVSKAHKAIYEDKTVFSNETVNRILQKESAAQETPAPEAATPSVPAGEADVSSPPAAPAAETPEPISISDDRLQKSGVKILQMALVEMGITVSAFELLELAGEETERLTVYGIYLAARGKGVQVQGIKVELDYLRGGEDTHLVFFQDESFALLRSISDTEVKLAFAPEKVSTFTIDNFMEQWNGYVVTLSKL